MIRRKRKISKRATKAAAIHPRDPAISQLLGIGVTTKAGTVINENTAMNLSAVWCAVKMISGSMSVMRVQVNAEDGSIASDKLDPRVRKILRIAPNPEMSPAMFVGTLEVHRQLWGNAYAEIVRDGAGRPLELWPLLPSRVRAFRDRESKRKVYEVYNVSGGSTFLDDSSMLHLPNMGYDGLKGYSPIHMARESMGAVSAAEECGAKFFGKGMLATGILRHPGQLGPGGQDNLRKSFEEFYGGLDNAHRVLVLEEGTEFTKLSIPPDDAQFLQTRVFGINEIARWFNIPPHKLKELSRATFANIEHQSIEYVSDTLLPHVVIWEQELARKLLTEQEQEQLRIEMDVSDLLRADIKTRFEAYGIGTTNGFLNPDEVRNKENLGPIPGGSGRVFLRPSNLAASDSFVTSPADNAANGDAANGDAANGD